MKAVTVRQPWAWAVTLGLKPVENRAWAPPRNLARFAIHSGMTADEPAWEWPAMRAVRDLWRPDMPEATLSAVLGVATLHSAHRAAACPGGDCARWGFSGDRMWHWMVTSVPLARPVPCPGRLRVWELPDDVTAQVLDQFAVTL